MHSSNIKRRVLLLGFFGVIIGSVDSATFSHAEVVPTESYLHWAEMDTSGNYYLFWKFDEETITFEAWAKTKGWLGLGLSSNGAMAGADIFLGWVADGKVELSDRHAIGNQMPLVDPEQNLVLLEGKETNQFTMLKFSRKFVTCDLNDRKIDEGTMRMIYAWNAADPVSANSVNYHGATQRGSRSLLLRDVGLPNAEQETSYEGMQTMDLTVYNVSLPTKRTTYWCRIQEIPDLGKKHHVVKVEPLIEMANLGVVHHIVVYFCHGNLQTSIEGEECWEGNMPENATKCDTVAFAWAVGQATFHWPDEAGLSIGGPDDPKFFNIEMHYDNPQGLTNVIDSSGIRLYYTDQLRQYDSGNLVLGTTLWFPPMSIPPNAEAFQVDAYCSSSCTNKIPDGGIKVFASLLHTHLVGNKVWTKHIRNGKELPEIGREDHYDFNYQQIRRLPTPVTILPGDDLITSCVYNTKGRTNMTFGGAGTDNEMCFNFMLYYPRIALQACTSSSQHYYPIQQMVMEKAMTGELHIDPAVHDNGDVYKLLDHITWNDENVKHFQNQLKHITGYTESCSIAKEGFGVFTGNAPYYKQLIHVNEPRVVDPQCLTASGITPLHVTSMTSLLTIVTLMKLLI